MAIKKPDLDALVRIKNEKSIDKKPKKPKALKGNKGLFESIAGDRKGYISISTVGFYNPAAKIGGMIKSRVQRELNAGKVTRLDPATASVEPRLLTPLEMKRFMATKKLRIYHGKNDFLTSVYRASKRYPLTERQCDAVLAAIKKLEEYDKLFENQEPRVLEDPR